MNKQLLEFIEKSLRRGVAEEQILSGLASQGWSKNELEESLAKTKEIISQEALAPLVPPLAPKKNDWDIDFKTISASEILLYLGGLIVCLAGITYVAMNWEQWNSPMRIMAILLPMLIVYGIGAPLWLKKKYLKQALIFIVTGSILFPMFLMVALSELKILIDSPDNFGLFISLCSFAFYFLSGFIFRNPVWSFLYPASGLPAYYFFLKIIGLENIGMTWAFLIPAVLYVFLGYGYEKKGKGDFGRYPYFLGFLTIFLSLIRLASDGDLLKTFMGNTCLNEGFSRYSMGCDWQFQPGWSIVIVGIIYLLIAYVIEKLKKYKLEELAKYEEFFNFFGPLLILAGTLYLSSGGQKPVYETLWLFSCLGFIFGSIVKKSRQFLYLGTLFLIIYIFDIGAEYFESNVGWPITLFVAGLASMAIGFLIEKLRRKYFLS